MKKIKKALKKLLSSRVKTAIFGISMAVFCLFLANLIGVANAAWQEPQASPPEGNAAPPINTSNVEQTKAGNLILSNDLTVGSNLTASHAAFGQAAIDTARGVNATGSGYGGYFKSDSGKGLGAYSITGTAMEATSGSATALVAKSTTGTAIEASSLGMAISASGNSIGGYFKNGLLNTDVYLARQGFGVYAQGPTAGGRFSSAAGLGVYALSTDYIAAYAHSDNNIGVEATGQTAGHFVNNSGNAEVKLGMTSSGTGLGLEATANGSAGHFVNNSQAYPSEVYLATLLGNGVGIVSNGKMAGGSFSSDAGFGVHATAPIAGYFAGNTYAAHFAKGDVLIEAGDLIARQSAGINGEDPQDKIGVSAAGETAAGYFNNSNVGNNKAYAYLGHYVSSGTGLYDYRGITAYGENYGGVFTTSSLAKSVAIKAEASDGVAVNAKSTGGTGVLAYSDSGTALVARSPGGTAADLQGKVKISNGDLTVISGNNIVVGGGTVNLSSNSALTIAGDYGYHSAKLENSKLHLGAYAGLGGTPAVPGTIVMWTTTKNKAFCIRVDDSGKWVRASYNWTNDTCGGVWVQMQFGLQK